MSEALSGIEVTLARADAETEERVESALWELGIGGFERDDDETWSALVEDPRPRAAGTVRWRLFVDGDDVAGLEERVGSALSGIDGLSFYSWLQTDLSFLTRWKEFFRPAQVSARIVVHPPWEVPEVAAGVRVEIDPGMAFGTGTHETTRLCLVELDGIIRPGDRVLDVGTGSGILAIAAALLGATRVDATENDPIAVAIANENFERNGVRDRCEASMTELESLPGGYDIVLANILPHTLSELHDGLVANVRPGGALVLSGILLRERDGVLARFADLGDAVAVPTMGEWCAIRYVRP